MEQDLPAGKAVKPRHLQKLRVYTPHAMAQVDHHRWNGGCRHNEYKGQPLNPNHTRASLTQHTGGTDWSTWMNIPTSSSLGHSPNSSPSTVPTATPDSQAKRQTQQSSADGGPEIRLPEQSCQRTRHLWDRREHQREKQSEASCQIPSSRPTPRARRSQRAALPHSITRRRGVFRRSSRGQSR